VGPTLRVVAGGRRGHAAPRRPGLLVSVKALEAGAGPGNDLVLKVNVQGERPPVRLYLYIDGDLVDARIPAEKRSEFRAPAAGAGRHLVTARAVDALGRWGGASMVVDLGAAFPATGRNGLPRGLNSLAASAEGKALPARNDR
jgi:hypothetical protein